MPLHAENSHGLERINPILDRCLQSLSPELRAKIAVLQEHPLLPTCPAGMHGIPNVFLRSALFGMVQRGQRKMVNKEILPTIRGLQIRYTGWQLDQADLDVFAHALYLASAQPTGKLVRFTAKGFLTGIHRSYGKPNRQWLKESLWRLTTSAVEIDLEAPTAIGTQPFSYADSLLDEFIYNETERSYFLKCNPRMVRLFDAGWTQIPWRQHVQLKTDLAKWLHGFYASHRTPYPTKVSTLRHLCGSNCHRLSDYRYKLRIALDELVRGGFLGSWQIDQEDKIHVDKRLPKTSGTT